MMDGTREKERKKKGWKKIDRRWKLLLLPYGKVMTA
jgi:hypothetical protein